MLSCDFAPQIALDHVIAVDHFADVQHLLIGQLRDAPLRREVDLVHDLGGLLLADAVDILQRDNDPLVGRKIDTSDTSHVICSCCRRRRLFLRSRCGENAKCRDDTRPSARAGIVVALMQNGCRVLKDSNAFRQPLPITELTPSALSAGGRFGAVRATFWPLCGPPLGPATGRPDCLGGTFRAFLADLAALPSRPCGRFRLFFLG